MRDEPYDVLVVGGGPAGSAAALAALAARPGCRVGIVDAAAFPRDKACGDGIAPQAVEEMRRLGVPGAVAGFAPVDRLRLVTPRGREVLAVPPAAAYVVPRQVLDARLHAAAVARGAEPVRHRVRAVVVRRDRVEVGSGLSGRVVVGADGANSVVRRALGVPANPPGTLAVAVRGYAPAPAAERGGDQMAEQLIAMVAETWPAYAWSFPIDAPGCRSRANVGFGLLRSAMDGAGSSAGRDALYEPLRRLLPDQPAEPRTLRAHHLPLSTWRPRQPDGRVLLAGDAASLINPLTGEGIYYAVLSGRLAGEAAAGSLAGRDGSTAASGATGSAAGRTAGSAAGSDAGAAYRRALRCALGRHLATTTALARLSRDPDVFEAGMALAARDPEVLDALVEVGLGRGVLPPRVLVSLLGRLLRRTVLP